MANEIGVVRVNDDNTLTLVFLYPIATPIQVGGQNVVPTPATSGGVSQLDPVVDRMLTTLEKTALDTGTLAYEMFQYNYDPGATPAQSLAKAQALYARRLTEFNTRYQMRYGGRVGQRFNAI